MKNQAQPMSTALENREPSRYSATKNFRSSSAFLRLAPEIRLYIYKYLFHGATVYFERDWQVVRFATGNYFPDITRVNRQLRSESLPLLYQNLVLQVGGFKQDRWTIKKRAEISLPEELTRHVERIQIWEGHLCPRNLSSLTSLKVVIYERYDHDVCEKCKDRREEVWFDSQDKDTYNSLCQNASKQMSNLIRESRRHVPYSRDGAQNNLLRLRKSLKTSKSLKIVMGLGGLFFESTYRDIRQPSERVVINIITRRIEYTDVQSRRAVEIRYARGDDDVAWGYIKALPQSMRGCQVRKVQHDTRSWSRKFEDAFMTPPWKHEHYFLVGVVYFILFLMVAAFERHRDEFGL